jgi:hypothetical protein
VDSGSLFGKCNSLMGEPRSAEMKLNLSIPSRKSVTSLTLAISLSLNAFFSSLNPGSLTDEEVECFS